MQKKYISLGLMSGTSGDGVDASVIYSDGVDKFESIKDKYFEYNSKIYKNFHTLKEKITNIDDLKKFSKEINELERKITLEHARIVKSFGDDYSDMLVGFHGQTIYHNANEKISKQLGDGKLLNQLTKKKIIYNFRKNDILNGGQGAPLTPIFHQMISSERKINLPICFLNIGGISNVTIIKDKIGSDKVFSKDIGPGNCLIDLWIRKNTDHKFDKDGNFAGRGNKNEIVLETGNELYKNRQEKDKLSFDTNDFDVSFCRGLSIEDGAATITNFTAGIISDSVSSLISKNKSIKKILVCGGGRRNKVLLNEIKKRLPTEIIVSDIDRYGLNGDFIESQAFAFLAIRSLKRLPISFPSTTNCKSPTTGGDIVEN